MAKRGKNISLFLMDGEATGKIKVTIANWNGIAYKIPVSQLAACRNIDELNRSGVYFLFGKEVQICCCSQRCTR